jgi:hypothetical protein
LYGGGRLGSYTAILTELDRSYSAPPGYVALRQKLFAVDQVNGEITVELKSINLGMNNLRDMSLLDGSHSHYQADPNNPETPKLFRVIEVRGSNPAAGHECSDVRTVVD